MDAYLFPRLWPIDGSDSTAWTIAGIAVLVLGVALVLWRSVPAVTGRRWHPHPDPTHLHGTGQRISDAIGPLPIVLLGIGVLQRDAAWYAVAGVLLAVWLGTVLVIGRAREQADPNLPRTTGDIVSPESDPVVPPATK